MLLLKCVSVMVSTHTKPRYANQMLKLGSLYREWFFSSPVEPLLVLLGTWASNSDAEVKCPWSVIQKYLLEKSLFHLVLQMTRMSSCRRLLVLVRLQLDIMFLLNSGQAKKIQPCLISFHA